MNKGNLFIHSKDLSRIGIFSIILLAVSSCQNLTEVDPANSATRTGISTVGTNEALVYLDNPVVVNSNTSYSSPNYGNTLATNFITANSYLETKCSISQYAKTVSFFPQTLQTTESNQNCFQVLNDTNTSTQAIQSKNGSWLYDTESPEFYQVNTFYHVNQIMSRYLEGLAFTHKKVHIDGPLTIPPATKWNMNQTKSFWLTKTGQTSTVKTYSQCFLDNLNAFFSPSQDILCFGWNSNDPNFYMVQDPTIIYHEVGHALVKSMMNQRNVTVETVYKNYQDIHPFQSDLGSLFYDEAGSLNEGIADYFSYFMNGRAKVGEWALGKLLGTHRPLQEDDSVHTANVSKVSGERLSYPQFLYYNPNQAGTAIEDVHYAGQIVTHYLVSLTEEFKNSCTFSSTDSETKHKEAANYVLLLLNESLAEIGDLTGKGSDILSENSTGLGIFDNVYFTNLNNEESFLWTQVVNPPNFRRFFRIFGKNIIHHISTNLCTQFTIDKSEQLLDDYGLLLFKSYNDKGQGLDITNPATTVAYSYDHASINGTKLFDNKPLAARTKNIISLFSSEVNENNRKRSILVSKDFIKLDDDAIAFVFDGQNDIKNILANLTFEGKNVTTTEGIAGSEYNNNNIKISPGEVVGVSLNLYNNSNSTMAGVQVLANDWDHMKLADSTKVYTNRSINTSGLSAGTITGGKAMHQPCIIDGFPLASEGGVTDTTSTTQNNCSHITKTNYDVDVSQVISSTTYPKYHLDSPQPICMVQYSDENETKWVSQDFFRDMELNLEDKDCLNNPTMSGSKYNPNECLIRMLPGASQSILGKIDAQKTWNETIGAGTSFSSSNLVLMEVNKWIQPGTKFNCRFRVRFSNCIDCYNNNNDGEDFEDYKYAGHAPYKVINFQFTVLD